MGKQSKLALEMPSVIFLLPGLFIAQNVSFTVDMSAGQSQGLNQGLWELPVWLFTWWRKSQARAETEG